MAKETKTHVKDGRAGFGLYAADVIVFDIFVQPDSKSLHYVDNGYIRGFIYPRSTQKQEQRSKHG